MKSRFLFPHWCRYVGYVLIIAHVPVVLFRKTIGFDTPGASVNDSLFNSHHVFFMTTTLLVAVGLFLAAFSKEKIEDEQICQLRLDSLQWAIYVNYILLIISLVFSTDTEHILFLNLLVPLVFFIVRFQWKIFQNNRLLRKDENPS
jgi:ABC-type sugar transport system permease subunit